VLSRIRSTAVTMTDRTLLRAGLLRLKTLSFLSQQG
jgi:hypothetical protein